MLVGFMGAGKSTVGPLLAARLGWTFVDADQWLERESGSTVAEIFEKNGEASFRRLEAETIRLLMAGENRVLALGGGALESEVTRSLLGDTVGTCVVFLKAPAETLMARCAEQSAVERASSPSRDGAALPVRPLLEELRQDPTRLEQKLAARLPHYLAAHVTVSTAELTPDEVAARILDELGGLSTLAAQPPAASLEEEHAP